jgi:DNA ligase-1
MEEFAALLDRLVLTPQRNAKLRLLVDYFRAVPDPDRGYALAALTSELEIPSVKPAMLRALVESRVDDVLFRYSYDYVGDLAETISLIWPVRHGANRSPELREVVERLQSASRSEGPKLVEQWLDALDATGRWALIKLVVGGLRIGVSARLTKQALADLGGKPINEIEEVWHAAAPPYVDLFAWLEGRGPRPESTVRAPFRPVMLSHAISDDELLRITPDAYAA